MLIDLKLKYIGFTSKEKKERNEKRKRFERNEKCLH